MGQALLPPTLGHLNLILVLPKLLQVHRPIPVPLKVPMARPYHQAHTLDHQMSYPHTQENNSVILF